MNNIRRYIKLSDSAARIKDIFITASNFATSYFEMEYMEQESFINHIIANNGPFIFKEIPLLYRQIIQYFADELQLNNSDIRLIGSAKTGFSLSPRPHYGKLFSDSSDLDFTIFNESLFQNLKDEFNLWKFQYGEKKIAPKEREIQFWEANLINVPKNIKRGFIDTYKIPNREVFPLTRRINNILYLIPFKLNEIYGIRNSKASLRVYKNEKCFLSQLRLNTEYVLRNL